MENLTAEQLALLAAIGARIINQGDTGDIVFDPSLLPQELPVDPEYFEDQIEQICDKARESTLDGIYFSQH